MIFYDPRHNHIDSICPLTSVLKIGNRCIRYFDGSKKRLKRLQTVSRRLCSHESMIGPQCCPLFPHDKITIKPSALSLNTWPFQSSSAWYRHQRQKTDLFQKKKKKLQPRLTLHALCVCLKQEVWAVARVHAAQEVQLVIRQQQDLLHAGTLPACVRGCTQARSTLGHGHHVAFQWYGMILTVLCAISHAFSIYIQNASYALNKCRGPNGETRTKIGTSRDLEGSSEKINLSHQSTTAMFSSRFVNGVES